MTNNPPMAGDGEHTYSPFTMPEFALAATLIRQQMTRHHPKRRHATPERERQQKLSRKRNRRK